MKFSAKSDEDDCDQENTFQILAVTSQRHDKILATPLPELRKAILELVSVNCQCPHCHSVFAFSCLSYRERAPRADEVSLGMEIVAICEARAPGRTKH